jgi:hypothetical protein
MGSRDELIADLSRDLPPVRRAPNINRLATAWFGLGAVFVVSATWLAGPARPGAFAQLLTEPRFLLETLLGAVAVAWTSLLAFRGAVPAALTRRFALAGFALTLAWLAQYVFGLADPALEPSELGKRGFCSLEVVAYSTPLILIALFLVRRLYPLSFVRTALSVGLAAGLMPALYMQLACMYEPVHILAFHVLPGLLMALAAAAIALAWRPKQTGA